MSVVGTKHPLLTSFISELVTVLQNWQITVDVSLAVKIFESLVSLFAGDTDDY